MFMNIKHKLYLLLISFASILILAGYTPEDFVSKGKDSFIFQVDSLNRGRPITVWTYLPQHFEKKSHILFVMHGNSRNASEYRDQWAEISERNNALLLVPEFSKKDFPEDIDYNMGHMFKMDSNDVIISSIPEADWSFSIIEPLFDYVKNKIKNNSEGYLIYGHSAGSQFVHRLILFKPDAKITKAVCANAGWYTLPDFNKAFPYGLKGTGCDSLNLKQAFSKDVTILLGTADTITTGSGLRRTPEAMTQGKYRLKRGKYFYSKCKEAANNLKIPFKWQIKYAPGVGHKNSKMAYFAEEIFFKQKDN